MKLNKSKCESLCVRGRDEIRFADGTLVKKCDESKYLGCMINDKGDPTREINKRLSDTYLTWKKLSEFWKHSDCDVRMKLCIYDAVIRTKLVYGLESVQVNDSLKTKIDAFQLKGLRQILKMQTTYVNRLNTNKEVFRRADEAVNSYQARQTNVEGIFRKKRSIIPISEYYEQQRRKLFIEIVTRNLDDPIRGACCDENLQLIEHGKKRVGRPRNNWWEHTLINFWDYLRKEHNVEYRYTALDRRNPIHINALKQLAQRLQQLEGGPMAPNAS